MYTQCPDCTSVFEISPEHLAAAGGMVRCGVCNTTFNALRRLTDAPPDTKNTESDDNTDTPAEEDIDSNISSESEHVSDTTNQADSESESGPREPSTVDDEATIAADEFYQPLEATAANDTASQLENEQTVETAGPQPDTQSDVPPTDVGASATVPETNTFDDSLISTDDLGDIDESDVDADEEALNELLDELKDLEDLEDETENDDSRNVTDDPNDIPVEHNSESAAHEEVQARDTESNSEEEGNVVNPDDLFSTSQILDEWNIEEGEQDLEALLADDSLLEQDDEPSTSNDDSTEANEQADFINDQEEEQTILDSDDSKNNKTDDTEEAQSDHKDDLSEAEQSEPDPNSDASIPEDSDADSATSDLEESEADNETNEREDSGPDQESQVSDDPGTHDDRDDIASEDAENLDSQNESIDELDESEPEVDELDDLDDLEDTDDRDDQATPQPEDNEITDALDSDAKPNVDEADEDKHDEAAEESDSEEDNEAANDDEATTDSSDIAEDDDSAAILTDGVDGQFDEDFEDANDLRDLGDYLTPRKSWARILGEVSLVTLLVLALGAQYVHHNRAGLATHPSMGPYIERAYDWLGIEVQANWNVTDYRVARHTIVPGDEQSSVLMARATIINNTNHDRPLPLVRLQLQNRWGDAIYGRVFSPTEYLVGDLPGSLEGSGRLEISLDLVNPAPDEEIGYSFDVCLDTPHGPDCGTPDIFSE